MELPVIYRKLHHTHTSHSGRHSAHSGWMLISPSSWQIWAMFCYY